MGYKAIIGANFLMNQARSKDSDRTPDAGELAGCGCGMLAVVGAGLLAAMSFGVAAHKEAHGVNAEPPARTSTDPVGAAATRFADYRRTAAAAHIEEFRALSQAYDHISELTGREGRHGAHDAGPLGSRALQALAALEKTPNEAVLWEAGSLNLRLVLEHLGDYGKSGGLSDVQREQLHQAQTSLTHILFSISEPTQ